MPSTLRRFAFLVIFMALALAGADTASKIEKSRSAELGNATQAVLWREPSDISSRNLLLGSGGDGRQPRGPYKFIEEDLEGSNHKFDV